MSISKEEKKIVVDMFITMDPIESVELAKLVYATLMHAHKHEGLGTASLSALGKHLRSKGAWDEIKTKVENHEGQSTNLSIRVPLLIATDKCFKEGLPAIFIKRTDEERAALAAVLTKMEPIELSSMTKLIYETTLKAEFPKEAIINFGKGVYARVDWPQVPHAIKEPMAKACDEFLRIALPEIFKDEEEVPVTAVADPESAQVEPETKDATPVASTEAGVDTSADAGADVSADSGEGKPNGAAVHVTSEPKKDETAAVTE